MHLTSRPRRNRKNPGIRALCRETTLSVGDLIYPLFLHEDDADTPLESLPGQTRWSVEGLAGEVARAHDLGIGAVVLFPKVPDALKTVRGEESFNPDGLIPRAIRAIKARTPAVNVITDVALDPYSSEGHDGIVEGGEILNDETVEVLCKQAVCQAAAGADVISPSDMMDGRVGAIREALDDAGHAGVGILAYTAKYASAYYGPFRGALDSAPKSGDKKTYQMDPANVREALREVELDTVEGADMVMVKPAGAYLDVIARVADMSTLPVAAYQVSGEYLMIKAAAASGWLDEVKVRDESLLAIKRAGADMILTYFAADVAAALRAGEG